MADSTNSIDELVLAALRSDTRGFWREVVDTMNEGLLIVGPDRRIVFLNKKAEAIVGRTLDQVRGAVCIEAINCPQCDCRCRLFEEGRAENVEVSIFSPAGSQRVLLKNARLLHDSEGQILGGVETFTDITKEVKVRNDSEQQAALLFKDQCRINALLDAMDDGVLAIDARCRVLMCASRTAEMLRWRQASQTVGRPLAEVLRQEPGFFGPGDSTGLDGRSFRIRLPDERPAEISFRRVRYGDDEMLGLLRLCKSAVAQTRPTGKQHIFHGIVSRSPRMAEIFRLVENAAQSNSNILIEGESGVGKELVARAIHQLGLRREQPFYAVNCGTFTGSLLLSELFGHERGAFTGAYKTTKGKLELAGSGTLFLDEVSEIPLHYQSVLLRVLEERTFHRVGGQQEIPLEARIVAATNVHLLEAVKQHRFRDDLLFRLRVIPISVPPLRERREDIPLLINHFALHPAVNLTGHELTFSDEAWQALEQHSWPGNVRELRNLVEYLCFMGQTPVGLEQLPPEFQHAPPTSTTPADRPLPSARPLPQPPLPAQPPSSATPPPSASPGPPPVLEQTNDEPGRILAALRQSHYHRTEAARLLGINRSTLWRRMKQLGIEV